jgi:hypothetical protein
MPQIFDPRRLARTPGFAKEGLYDDLDMAEQDDYQQMLPPPSQKRGGLSEMLAAAPDAPLPTRSMQSALPPPPTQPMREYDGGPSVDPGPQMRQRITLDPRPLPPKTGVLRKILGGVASIYAPMFADEIAAPGYRRQVQEWEGNRDRMMDEGKLNHQQAQEDQQVASARAAMARAEASNAQRQRTIGQMDNDKSYNLGPNQARFDKNNQQVAINRLPPAAKNTIKIGRDWKPFFGEGVEGKDYILADSSVAPSIINSTARVDKGLAYFSQLVDKKMPGATQEEKDLEIVRLANEQQKLKEEKEKALTNRANRVTTGRSSGAAGTASANAEARRSVAEMAKAQVAEAGDVDKAIANMNAWPSRDETAEKVLLHLKAMKGTAAMRPSKGKVDVNAIAARFGAGAPAATAPPPAPATAKPAGAPAVGTIKGGYKFKGGDPSKPENWEKVK